MLPRIVVLLIVVRNAVLGYVNQGESRPLLLTFWDARRRAAFQGQAAVIDAIAVCRDTTVLPGSSPAIQGSTSSRGRSPMRAGTLPLCPREFHFVGEVIRASEIPWLAVPMCPLRSAKTAPTALPWWRI
ncbi:hypothetical protein ANCDUO_02174 [Ancylostoma duodenale]|uniref:Secreted protein n=1 Tax=Ancylostoma duodenale TaxID=51022 RepID=A0A0C2DX49_9BILA|nr:hypothetical protein ANCDUO_02174 [Ancylostoma duodenale]